VADYLKVDLNALEETATALQHLRSEFADAASIAEEGEAAVGAHQLNSALHSFATNWKHHREGLLKSIDAIEKMASSSHQAYSETDHQLAKTVQDAAGKAPR
jgi:hypothetical protein